ncbi:protein of unknown function [Candidatus Nitrosocosmicus franklandus]|uniref:Uncharacterized protein n=1 Tax=Candidatus Nitrosocosmicus franklandianus TaxID=1798806 RepID=A0A484IC16_9ARCH|nr:protein of unknown function [Candidatus Nitrosocosmicus franklandus]
MSGQNEHKNPIPDVDTMIDNDSLVLFIERSMNLSQVRWYCQEDS